MIKLIDRKYRMKARITIKILFPNASKIKEKKIKKQKTKGC